MTMNSAWAPNRSPLMPKTRSPTAIPTDRGADGLDLAGQLAAEDPPPRLDMAEDESAEETRDEAASSVGVARGAVGPGLRLVARIRTRTSSSCGDGTVDVLESQDLRRRSVPALDGGRTARIGLCTIRRP